MRLPNPGWPTSVDWPETHAFPPFTTNGSPFRRVHHRGSFPYILESAGHRLLVVVIGLVVDNVEELELVDSLGGGDDTEPVTELHLLQELLGPRLRISWSAPCPRNIPSAALGRGGERSLQVLEVPAGQLVVGNDLDLSVTDLGDLDGLAQVADTALDLDLLVQELLEGRDIEDLVASGLRGVDDELQGDGVVSVVPRVGGRFGNAAYLLGGLGGPALLLQF